MTARITVRLPAAENPKAAKASSPAFNAKTRQSPVHPANTAPTIPSGFNANAMAWVPNGTVPGGGGVDAGSDEVAAQRANRLSARCIRKARPTAFPTIRATTAITDCFKAWLQGAARPLQARDNDVSTVNAVKTERACCWAEGGRLRPVESPTRAPKIIPATLIKVPSTPRQVPVEWAEIQIGSRAG